MKILQDFQKFALRGNVVDLAIGFTVGAAFTTVVRSLVSDILMPPIGVLTGNADFADHFWILHVPEEATVPEGGFPTLQSAQEAGVATLNYGLFFNNCLAMLIVAIAMFVIIHLYNRVDERLDDVFGEAPPPAQEPTEKKCEFCRSTIPFRAVRCPQCTSHLPEAGSGADVAVPSA